MAYTWWNTHLSARHAPAHTGAMGIFLQLQHSAPTGLRRRRPGRTVQEVIGPDIP